MGPFHGVPEERGSAICKTKAGHLFICGTEAGELHVYGWVLG